MSTTRSMNAYERKRSTSARSIFLEQKGILLCDRGCSVLNRSHRSNSSYTADEIVRHFLEQYPEITFVVTFVAKKRGSGANKQSEVETTVYPGMGYNSLPYDFLELLNKVWSFLPQPESDAVNAMNWLKGNAPDAGRSHWGGLHMSVRKSASTIKISSRALLDLLSGNESAKSFLQGHGFEPSEQTSVPLPNPFRQALGQGQLIADISIERSDASDDDWIVIRLEGPDPAISRFTARSAAKQPKR